MVTSPGSLLATSSPGLLATLQRVFSAEEVSLLSEDYGLVVNAGGLSEDPVIREEGVSYNPRPARIATIVLAETPHPELHAIRLALWSTIGASRMSDAPECIAADLRMVRSILEESSKLVSQETREGGSLIEVNTSSVVEVLLAVQLDTVRHLHMTTLSPEARERVVETSEAMVRKVEQIVASVTVVQTLIKKLQHSISQQRRILTNL